MAAPIPSWFSSVPWLHVYVGFSVTLESFEQYLNWRQMKRCSIENPPEKLQSIITKEEHAKTNDYNRDKLRFGIFSSIIKSGTSLLMTWCFVGPWFWKLAGRLIGSTNIYYHSLAFLGINQIFGEFYSLPFDIYGDFIIEQKHGFNKKTVALFVKDKILSLAITACIGSPVICMLIWLIKWGGPNFHIWLWGFSVSFTFFMMAIYPNVIAPLFNKYECLKNTELRAKIEDLAKQVKFPLTEVYEMDGSKRSSHSNAYFYGFWNWKRIVLFDTLLHLPHDQILAILSHEIGHWKRSHMMKTMTISLVNLFGIFYLYGMVMNNDYLYKSFGYMDTHADIIGLSLFGMILSPYNMIFGLILTLLSRKHEFEADAFACHLGYAGPLKDGLTKIHTENKSLLNPDPWYSWWNYSHPPLLERLRAIENIENQEKKME